MRFAVVQAHTRVLAVAFSLASSTTCTAPTSPPSASRHSQEIARGNATAPTSVATVTVTLLYSQIAVGNPSFASARARDASGIQLFGVPVTWRSDNIAVATVEPTGFIRGRSTGRATIIATMGGVSGQATLTVGTPPAQTPQVAPQLALTTQPVGGPSGAVFATQPVVEVRDSSGARVSASTVPVTAMILSGPGILGGTTTVNAASGVASFTDLRITGPGTFVLAFVAPGLTQVASQAITITGVTPTASQLAVVTQPSGTATSGVSFSTQPAVALRDATGNPVDQSGVNVTAAIASGTGTLGGTTTVATVNGIASFTDLRITGAGLFALVFTASELTQAISGTITVAVPPAVATQLAIVTQPSGTALSGAVLATQPAIALRDASNNPVSQSGVLVYAAVASGSGTLGGITTVATDASGVARFTNLLISGAGDHTLRFSAPGLSVTTSGTISISAATAPPTGSRRVIFASDWSTATGSSDAARRDLARAFPWGGYGGPTSVTDIIPSTGLNFPTTNVMRVNGIRTGGAIQWLHTGQVTVTSLPYAGVGLGDLPVGESNYYRLYMRMVYPPDREPLGNGNHPIEESAGGGNWSWTISVDQNGWRPRFTNRNAMRYALSGGGREQNPVYLARHATYRLEWQIRRVSTTTFETHVRVYDAAGTLLYDDDDFVAIDASLASNPQHPIGDPITFRRFQVGTNGPGLRQDPVTDIGPMWYLGGVAVCRGGWCGAYTPGEAP